MLDVHEIDVPTRLRQDMPVVLVLGLGTGGLLNGIANIAMHGWGWDAHAYYLAARQLDYSRLPNTVDAYLYSPVFAQALRPAALLPWPVFAALWSVVAFLSLAWILRDVRWPMRFALLYAALPEVASGNVHWLIAVALAGAIRRPSLWALPALTKIGPAVGMAWFLFRGEWGRLASALAVPLSVAGISYLVDPAAWHSWGDLLLRSLVEPNPGAVQFVPPAPFRLAGALVITAYAASTSRRWLLAVAACLASPNWALPALVILYAIPMLRIQEAASTKGRDVIPSAL
nr:DUF2029 domain-containing protein [Propionibacterium sp.]